MEWRLSGWMCISAGLLLTLAIYWVLREEEGYLEGSTWAFYIQRSFLGLGSSITWNTCLVRGWLWIPKKNCLYALGGMDGWILALGRACMVWFGKINRHTCIECMNQ